MIRYQWAVKITLKDAKVQYTTALYRLMQVAWIRKRILGIGPPLWKLFTACHKHRRCLKLDHLIAIRTQDVD
jgi:hypothetical protein